MEGGVPFEGPFRNQKRNTLLNCSPIKRVFSCSSRIFDSRTPLIHHPRWGTHDGSVGLEVLRGHAGDRPAAHCRAVLMALGAQAHNSFHLVHETLARPLPLPSR